MKYHILCLLIALSLNSAYTQSSIEVRFSSDSINTKSEFGLIVLNKDDSIQIKTKIKSNRVLKNIPPGEYVLDFYKVGCVKYKSKINLKDDYSLYEFLKPRKLDFFHSLSNDYSLTFVDSSYCIWEIVYQNINRYTLSKESINITPTLDIKEIYWHGFLYDTTNTKENYNNYECIFDKLMKLNNFSNITMFCNSNNHTLIKSDSNQITVKNAILFDENVGDINIYFSQDSIIYMDYIQYFDDLNHSATLFNLLYEYYKGEADFIQPMVIGDVNKYFNSNAFIIKLSNKNKYGKINYVTISYDLVNKPVITGSKLSFPVNLKSYVSIKFYIKVDI